MQSSLLVLIWFLSWCGLGACRACHDKTKFTENGFRMRLLLRFRFWRFCQFIHLEGFTFPTLCTISLACFQQNWIHLDRSFHTKVIQFLVSAVFQLPVLPAPRAELPLASSGATSGGQFRLRNFEIGRASCRERVYVLV